MRITIMRSVFVTIVLILFPVFLFAGKDLDSLLRALDKTIENSQKYSDAREVRLAKLKQIFISKTTDQQCYNISVQLYNEYRSYKYDSAYSYAGKMLFYAERLNNPNLICESKIALAFSCMSAGLYKEATEISNSIDTTQLRLKNKASVYSLLSVLNLVMADFAAAEPYYRKYHLKSLQYCLNSIALFKKDSPEAFMAKMRACQLEEDYVNAIVTAEQYLSVLHPESHDYAIVVSSLGFFYQVRHDTAKAMECFALAAISDIKSATKETSAIRQLAELLFTRGDIQHAYKYAIIALDDANFYNARQRKIEVGRILPIIEAGRFEIIEQQKNKLLIYAGLISLLFVLFVIATLVILRQKKRLTSARAIILRQNTDLLQSNEQLTAIQKKISKQNIDLLHTNEKLKEAQKIKDEYIGYFFSANSSYIEKTEELHKMIARKIRNKQFDELMQLSDSSGLRKEKEDMFTLFDRIFMKLFPEFVDRYNLLFKEEDHVVVKPDGSLTPEIRIFALIRLGITESERIARFLDFSLSTVKNYKTKAKNRSVVPNELFEHKIMEIESVKTVDTDKTE